MSNADELLTDARQAARRFAEIDPVKVADRLDAAEHALGLWGQLDDHISVSATPPADWPLPVPVGRLMPAGWRDLLYRAILASGIATETGVNLGQAGNAETMANAIAAQIIRESDQS